MTPPDIHFVSAFIAGRFGGNPAPVVLDGHRRSDSELQAIARGYGLECVSTMPAPAGSDCDIGMRFWMPTGEVTMCGHAALAALWVLQTLGRVSKTNVRIWTSSGVVDGRRNRRSGKSLAVEISQPAGEVSSITSSRMRALICDTLRMSEAHLGDFPIQNASTSRMKTLVPLKSPAMLDALAPDFGRMKSLCLELGSTGLYPYAIVDKSSTLLSTRQFPKASGYAEDPATGVAAAALAFGALESGLVAHDCETILVQQGRAMGRPSEIAITFRREDGISGCWIGGHVQPIEGNPSSHRLDRR